MIHEDVDTKQYQLPHMVAYGCEIAELADEINANLGKEIIDYNDFCERVVEYMSDAFMNIWSDTIYDAVWDELSYMDDKDGN